MGSPAKKPRQNGIRSWSHKVGKPKLSKRSALRPAAAHEKRSLPLVFELRSIAPEKLSPETIQTLIEYMQGANAYKKMNRFALAALRRYLKKYSIKDFTR